MLLLWVSSSGLTSSREPSLTYSPTQYPILAPAYLSTTAVCVFARCLYSCFSALLQTWTSPSSASPYQELGIQEVPYTRLPSSTGN